MTEDNPNRKERTFLVILIILLIISVSYTIYSEYSRYTIQLSTEALIIGYNRGVSDGVAEAVSRIHSETEYCQPIPIMFNNVTKYIIDIECLQTPG